MNDTNIGETTGYIRLALQQAKTTAEAFLSSIRELKTTHTQFSKPLKPATNGSYILAHPKKDSSTHITNFVVFIAGPAAYAMLATLAEPIKFTLPTNTTTRGHIRQQITTLNLTSHTRSILGRTYAQLLVNPDITQLNNNLPPLQYNQTKGLTGWLRDKMAWTTALLAHTSVLRAYDEDMQKQELEDLPPKKIDQQKQAENPIPSNLPKSKLDHLPQNKGKDKMPPM
jgi:hypothetical protein